jgi:hypothetical protein
MFQREQNVRWLVINVDLPLMSIDDGFTPLELESMPRSRLRIAVPKDCTVMPEGVEEGGTTSQQVIMCLDGLPRIMTNCKQGQLPAGVVDDDDWITAMSIEGLLYDPAGNASEAGKRSDAERFWNEVRASARYDTRCWKTIVEAMAQGRCYMTMVHTDGWTKVDSVATTAVSGSMSTLKVSGLKNSESVGEQQTLGPSGTAAVSGSMSNLKVSGQKNSEGVGEQQTSGPSGTAAVAGQTVGGAESGGKPGEQKQGRQSPPAGLLSSPDIIPNYHTIYPREDSPELSGASDID